MNKDDLSKEKNLLFVFLLYKSFDDVKTSPEVWVMPAADVKTRKRPWFEKSAVYYGVRAHIPSDLESFKNAWHLIE